MTTQGGTGTKPDECLSSTGIKVIVVGTGVAGLSTAIECHQKGHSVIVYEKMKDVTTVLGDGITIGANGSRIARKWGGGKYHDMILPYRYNMDRAKVFDFTGFHLGEFQMDGYNKGRGYTVNRGKLILTMYEFAKSIGINVQLDSDVTDYWETESEAGVIVNGQKVAADCVVCAEGINSPGRTTITGQEIEMQKTGFSGSRGYLDSSLLAQDPKMKWIFDDMEAGDCIYAWLGPGVHFCLTPKKEDKELFWYCCHKAAPRTGDNEKVEQVIKCIEDWPVRDKLEPIIRKSKEAKFVSGNLEIGKPLKTWLSPRGRMIVIGDAAHATVPSSGQGGSQAIEDAAVLAIALELGGKKDIALSLAAVEKIRHQRSEIIQQGGVAVLHFAMQQQDFESLRKDPSVLQPPHPAWIFDHDCQEYTYQEFPLVVDAIRNNREYIPHNIPMDGKYRMEYNSNTKNVEET